jgi:diphthine-ammonia ligase
MPDVAVSWSGGKDSSLALHDAQASGCRIKCLLTFASSQGDFRAHPIGVMSLQAEALGLPHQVIAVKEPYEESYENAIRSVKEECGIEALVTGDIDEPAGHDPNWMANRTLRCGVDLMRPLWHQDRLGLLKRMLSLRYKIVFSCVKKPWFTEEWLGLELSERLLNRLSEMGERKGFDICGEQGEYHTIVLDGPGFRKSIRISSYSKHAEGSIMYISPENARLTDRDA